MAVSNTTHPLTAAEITALMQGTRERGFHERYLRNFDKSGELYADLTEVPQYKGKNLQGIRNQLTKVAAEKISTEDKPFRIKIVLNEPKDETEDTTFVLINLDVYEAQLMEDESDEDETLEEAAA